MKFQMINNFDSQYTFNNKAIYEIISKISKNEHKKFESINLIISTDTYLNQLKRTYFNKDHYTDVITFNLEDSQELIEGEIYVSMHRVIDNAHRFNIKLNDELKRIIIHGVLHLIGYNDIEEHEKKMMTKLENQYMEFSSKLILN
tara:strand:+ start:9362 stop:9796 length:435 start_codon:yes stop_codon:yes gene_type:complete